MMASPALSFPAVPTTPSTSCAADLASRRPASMHLSLEKPVLATKSHRRAASTLPSFSFNAADTSGLKDMLSEREDAEEAVPTTPTRHGHRRGGSEFVGGDSRLGVAGAISLSPTKTTAPPLVPPSVDTASGRRGHAHRRSDAMSAIDPRAIMQAPELAISPASNLPSTPKEHPTVPYSLDRLPAAPETSIKLPDTFGPPPEFADLAEHADTRPPSRARVEFSDKVEYIPRPLSTISSETESSLSRGHSVNNSISSVLSLGTPSPPSSRYAKGSVTTAPEDDRQSTTRSSLEISKKIEKEGEWLKGRALSRGPQNAMCDVAKAKSPAINIASEPRNAPRNAHCKPQSISHALGLDRRRSEPTISTAAETPRLSTISLQDTARTVSVSSEAPSFERRSSTRKIKDWALMRITRKGQVGSQQQESSHAEAARPHTADVVSVPGKGPISELVVPEADLNTVFDNQAALEEENYPASALQRASDVNPQTLRQPDSPVANAQDEWSAMLDLDAALGPFDTPALGAHRQRRELHSSRLTKDFIGPGGHYHRRGESAPETTMPVPDFGRLGTPSTVASLPDVFEGDEDRAEEEAALQTSAHALDASADEETGVGIEIVDVDPSIAWVSTSWSSESELQMQRGDWEPERPSTSYADISAKLSAPTMERRAASIIDETIPEEMSPVEAASTVEIVEAHEEPRASSLTKSSDSSETPTLLAAPTAPLEPGAAQSVLAPTAHQTAAFPSPDIARRQGSFDNSRLGTSASSMTDNRTMSSCTTGDQSHDVRVSVDDVPSLTSSRSTMISTTHANNSRRDFSDHPVSSVTPRAVDPTVAAERRRKRASIQSLSQLVGGSFSGKLKVVEDPRPQTAASTLVVKRPKKENRLKKLMFWRSKDQRRQAAQADTARA